MKLLWLFLIVFITTGVRKLLPVYYPICEKRWRRSFSILVFHSKLNTPCALLTKTETDTLWHKGLPGVSCHFVTQTLGRGVFRGRGSRSSRICCRRRVPFIRCYCFLILWSGWLVSKSFGVSRPVLPIVSIFHSSGTFANDINHKYSIGSSTRNRRWKKYHLLTFPFFCSKVWLYNNTHTTTWGKATTYGWRPQTLMSLRVYLWKRLNNIFYATSSRFYMT